MQQLRFGRGFLSQLARIMERHRFGGEGVSRCRPCIGLVRRAPATECGFRTPMRMPDIDRPGAEFVEQALERQRSARTRLAKASSSVPFEKREVAMMVSTDTV